MGVQDDELSQTLPWNFAQDVHNIPLFAALSLLSLNERDSASSMRSHNKVLAQPRTRPLHRQTSIELAVPTSSLALFRRLLEEYPSFAGDTSFKVGFHEPQGRGSQNQELEPRRNRCGREGVERLLNGLSYDVSSDDDRRKRALDREWKKR